MALSSGYYYRDDLLQYREVRVGLTKFYRILDSLFNELYDDENYKTEDIFEYLVEDGEPIDESSEDSTAPEEISCYSWSSLNQLVDDVHQNVMNSYIALNETNPRLKDLQNSITTTESQAESFEMKLYWVSDHIDITLAPTAHSFFTIIRKSLTNIKEFQQTLSELATNIDEDHVRIHRAIVMRLAKVQRHFENVIQSKNDAHMECTCDAVKVMHDMTTKYFADMDQCVDRCMDQLDEVIEATQSSLDSATQFVLRATLPGITPKQSVYDIHGKMTTPVRMQYVSFKSNFSLVQRNIIVC